MLSYCWSVPVIGQSVTVLRTWPFMPSRGELYVIGMDCLNQVISTVASPYEAWKCKWMVRNDFGFQNVCCQQWVVTICCHRQALTQRVEGCCRDAATKSKLQKNCAQDDIKLFTRFTLQPTSTTEIAWYLVHFHLKQIILGCLKWS
jgi:hypothetical protein